MTRLNWKPVKKSEIPVHSQIANYILNKIESNEWSVGSVIPSQRELASAFEVNRSTIVYALDILKSDGILESRGRGGTIVKSGTMPSILQMQPKWQNYIEEGIHMPNYKTIKMINESEPDDSMIKLCSGEASTDVFSKDKMQRMIEEVAVEVDHMGYEWPKGNLRLRVALSKYLATLGIEASPDCILIVSGALQAFQLISIGLLQTGSNVLIEKPSYIYSLQILETLGMRRVGIDVDSNGIIPNKIPSQLSINRSSLLYVIPNFQNPTSVLMSLDRRKELIKLSREKKLPIIEDDVYGELWIDEKPPTSLKSLDVSGNVIYVSSVSKTLSPGLRIGWAVGPESVINRLADIRMQTDYGSSTLSQLVVAKWLESGLYEKHLHDLRIDLKKRRDFTMDLLDKYFKNLATWDVPKGGYYVWLELKENQNMYKIFEEAYKKKILLYPGYIYEASSNNSLRISYSSATFEDIHKGLKVLSEIIKDIN